jgi:hypothetical protein
MDESVSSTAGDKKCPKNYFCQKSGQQKSICTRGKILFSEFLEEKVEQVRKHHAH